MPIKIDFVSNTRDLLRGTGDIERALDDVADSLDDVARDGSDLGRELSGSAREGETSLGRLDRTFRELADSAKKVERAADDAGDAVKDVDNGGSKGFGKLSEGASELTSEIGSNLGEAVSSVRDNLADLGQVGQDTLGGLAGTLASTGPAGIAGAAVLAAGAVGLGAITAELEKQQEQADELKRRLQAAYQAAVTEGRDYLDVAQIIADAQDLMFNPDRAEEYKRIQEDAKAIHLDQSTLMKANAGDLAAQATVHQAILDYLDSEDSRAKNIYGTMKHHTDEAKAIRDRWAGITDATNEQRDAASNAQRITSDFLLGAADQAGKATSEVDKFGNELIKLPDGTEFVIDAKTGQAHQDMDRFYGDADGKIEKLKRKDIKLRVRVDDSAIRSYQPPVKAGTVVYRAQGNVKQRG